MNEEYGDVVMLAKNPMTTASNFEVIDYGSPPTPPPMTREELNQAGKEIAKANARYIQNEKLAKQMGVYVMQLCRLRVAMGRKELTRLLNEERKKRLEKIAALREHRTPSAKLKEARNDRSQDSGRESGRGVRRNRP